MVSLVSDVSGGGLLSSETEVTPGRACIRARSWRVSAFFFSSEFFIEAASPHLKKYEGGQVELKVGNIFGVEPEIHPRENKEAALRNPLS